MANEAVMIELGPNGGNPVMRTVADGNDISKGTICKLTSVNTASISSDSAHAPFAGIARDEKKANDGSTRLACYTEGVFDLTCAADDAPAVGELVALSGANNLVGTASEADIISGAVVGKAEEVGGAGEVIRVRLTGY